MANKIVLISDDSDFFDYIKVKLELRKSDELFTFGFDSVLEKYHLLDTALLIVNSENTQEKTLDLINIFKNSPIIITLYNEDETFRRKCFRAGVFDVVTLLISDADFRARLIPALNLSSLLEKNKQYRKILTDKKIMAENQDIFIDYTSVLDKELEEIYSKSKKAVFLAISPTEKSKFLLKPAIIESAIINNIRKNDILMNYAPNKYFLLMFDCDIKGAEKLWNKISKEIPEKIYAGFCVVSNQKRQQLINEALNKLHHAINTNKEHANVEVSAVEKDENPVHLASTINFKVFKKEFGQKIEQIISPVFYQVQQKYSSNLSNIVIEQSSGEGFGNFCIKGKYLAGNFKVSCPGFSKINIDIVFQKDSIVLNSKRIVLEPREFEQGILEGLLNQFVLEYKREVDNDN